MTSTQHPAVAAFLAARQREEQSSSQVPEFFPLKSFVQLYIKSQLPLYPFWDIFYPWLMPVSIPEDNGKPYCVFLNKFEFQWLAQRLGTSPKIVQQVFMEIYYDEYTKCTD